MGALTTSVGTASSLSLRLSGTVPYLAIANGVSSDVQSYSGGWTSLGSFTSGNIGQVSLSLDKGVPYVAYLGTDYQARVMSYNGSWSVLGSQSFVTSNPPVFEVRGGTAYLVYQNASNDADFTKSDTAVPSWSSPLSIAGSLATSSKMALDIASGEAYVLYTDSTAKLFQLHSTGGTFGAPSIVLNAIVNSSDAIGVAGSGTAYSIFIASDSKLYWGTDSVLGSISSAAVGAAMAMYGNVPYVAYINGSNAVQVAFMSGSVWTNIADLPVTAQGTVISLDISSDGSPYVAFNTSAGPVVYAFQ